MRQEKVVGPGNWKMDLVVYMWAQSAGRTALWKERAPMGTQAGMSVWSEMVYRTELGVGSQMPRPGSADIVEKNTRVLEPRAEGKL